MKWLHHKKRQQTPAEPASKPRKDQPAENPREETGDWQEKLHAALSPANDEVQILSLHTFISVLARKWRMFLLFVLCGALVFAALFYVSAKYTASTVMSMNYEESSKGRNPNGTRFNVSDLRSLDVASGALESAGLAGQISPEEIIDAISITTVSNRSFVSVDDYYITSSYRITFRKPFFGMGKVSAEDMLALICKTYKEKFYDEHIITAKILDSDETAYDTMDYSDIASHFTVMADRIDRYLNMRINEASSFITEDGETFKSLSKLVSNLKNYDLSNYASYIWENGISKDKLQQEETLHYINHNLEWIYTENMAENQARLSTINEYNQAMTSSILIPTYDDQGEFYMSRTKTGIDDMAVEADQQLTKANEMRLQVSMNEDKIQKLQQEPSQEQRDQADQMVSQIHDKMTEIVDKVAVTDNAYTLQKTRNYIAFEKSAPSFLNQIHYKRVAAICLGIFLLVYIFYAYQKKRRHGIA